MTTWIRQHIAAIASATKQILSAPGLFLFNVVVVAMALSLPIAGLTLIENTRPISGQLSIEPELSLFLKPELNRNEAKAFGDTIKNLIKRNATPAKVVFIPREAALSSLQNSSGLGDALATLGNNPLPDAYVLSFEQTFFGSTGELPAELQTGPARIDALAAQLKKLPEVDHVQIDSDWIKRLAALMHLAQFALIAIAATLGIVVITVIFNTTRLQVLSHRTEIMVFRLLGATSHYIRRPYYYMGALLGLIAGLSALALVAVALHPLNDAIIKFASLYGSEFRLVPLNSTFSIYLLALCTLLGLFSAFLSVRHQVNQFK